MNVCRSGIIAVVTLLGVALLAIWSTYQIQSLRAASSLAQAQPVPRLTIPDDIEPSDPTADTVQVPVTFAADGAAIASVVFSIDYDETLLDFDPTDGDEDGIPDAVEFTLPAAFNGSTPTISETGGLIGFLIADVSAPLATLPDGQVVTMTLRIREPVPEAEIRADIRFTSEPVASFGNTSGQSVSGSTDDGSVILRNPTQGPILSLPDTDIEASPGDTVAIPIQFTANDNTISTATFSISFDTNALDFDPTDGDEDGTPDAVDFTLPAAFTGSTPTVDTENGVIGILVSDLTPPLSALPDDQLLTFRVDIAETVTPGTCVPILFDTNPAASFGSTDGQSVSGSTRNGRVCVEDVDTPPPPPPPPPPPTVTPEPAEIMLVSSAADVAADGRSTAYITATVRDQENNPMPTQSITFTTTSPGTFQPQQAAVSQDTYRWSTPFASGRHPMQADAPALTIADSIPVASGGTVEVPVALTTAGNDLTTIAFSIDYDETLLTLADNGADSDGDGIPDAITFNLPAAFNGSTPTVDTENGVIGILVSDFAPPLATLPDGSFVTIQFEAANVTTTETAAVAFGTAPEASFGSTVGNSVSGTTSDGSVRIAADNGPRPISPTLTIASSIPVTSGGTVEVPVVLTTAGNDIATVFLSIDYDETLLTLADNGADSDGDGTADAVTFNLPAAFNGSTPTVDTENGVIGIIVSDFDPPLDALPDGPIATIRFEAASVTAPATAAVAFGNSPEASFGSTDGISIPGTTSDGSVRIAADNGPRPISPELTIASSIPVAAGGTVEVPVVLTTAGNDLASVAFSIDYDENLLTLADNGADSDGDGNADAVTFNLPAAFSGSTPTVDTENGVIGILVSDFAPPLAALPDGPIATIQFEAASVTAPATAAVAFGNSPEASFGSTAGNSVSGITSDGSVRIDAVPLVQEVTLQTDNNGQAFVSLGPSDTPGTAQVTVQSGDIIRTLTINFTDGGRPPVVDGRMIYLPFITR